MLSRNHQLDFFRGLLLILIALNHFLAYDDIIRYFTYGFIGWVSAAEGFVFLSGLTAGLVYTYKFMQKGQAYISTAGVKRAWTIYKYHIILFLLSVAILFSHPLIKSYWYGDFSEFTGIYRDPVSATLMGLLLLNQPIFLDILPMYAIFMLLVPGALILFQKGHHWLVLILSFLLYLVGVSSYAPLLFSRFLSIPYVEGYFNLLSWQFLFFAGLFIGFLYYHGATVKVQRNKYLFGLSLALMALFFVLSHLKLDAQYPLVEFLSDKKNLRPLRLLNFAAIFYVLMFIASSFPKWFEFKPVCYLGKYSLEVFSLHIVLVISLKPVMAYLNERYSIAVTDTLFIFPFAILMAFLVVIPALYLAPLLAENKKKSLKYS